MKHVDDWLDEPSTNETERYAKACLEIARLPAYKQFELPESERYPPLFCTYEGERFRCTGASRLGDVWLTADHTQQYGYQKRVDLAKCSDWGKQP